MKALQIHQGSDAWDQVRYMMPTASRFSELITPKRLQYSASAKKYQLELIAKQLGIHIASPPSFWMDRGTEEEPNAILCYERKHDREVERVGFVMLDDESAGGSPDALVGDDGGLEIKCPSPEVLMEYHLKNVLPTEYWLQVQGYLWITNRDWWDFFAYHPELPPFEIRVEPDLEVHEALAKAVPTFNEELANLKAIFEGKKTGMDYLFAGAEEVTL